MDKIAALTKQAKKIYDAGGVPIELIGEIADYCIKLLNPLEVLPYKFPNGGKNYVVFSGNKEISRPIVKDIYISSHTEFARLWALLTDALENKSISKFSKETVNSVLYTAAISYSACFDIWKKKSRKTPGTYFEILLGSILTLVLGDFKRSKFISLPNQSESVSTDIVFDNGELGIVVPAKITTRERIVQPYAHQRILDSIFGKERYKSILVCVSETQRDDENQQVNEICVPGTIKLFQEHLSQLHAIYYLDPPARYMQADLKQIVKVSTLGDLITKDIFVISKSKTKAQAVLC